MIPSKRGVLFFIFNFNEFTIFHGVPGVCLDLIAVNFCRLERSRIPVVIGALPPLGTGNETPQSALNYAVYANGNSDAIFPCCTHMATIPGRGELTVIPGRGKLTAIPGRSELTAIPGRGKLIDQLYPRRCNAVSLRIWSV